MANIGNFRNQKLVPLDWADLRGWNIELARAIFDLQLSEAQRPITVVSITASYSMVDIDALIKIDATDGNRTVFLLTSAGRAGRLVEVKKIDASANTVTIDPSGSETIDGNTTIVLTSQYAMRGLRSDGTNWHIVSAIGYTET